MTPTEAVGFLTEAAWQQHRTGPAAGQMCRCLVADNKGRYAIEDESRCNCGAVQHNARVKEALMVLGGAGAARRQTRVK